MDTTGDGGSKEKDKIFDQDQEKALNGKKKLTIFIAYINLFLLLCGTLFLLFIYLSGKYNGIFVKIKSSILENQNMETLYLIEMITLFVFFLILAYFNISLKIGANEVDIQKIGRWLVVNLGIILILSFLFIFELIYFQCYKQSILEGLFFFYAILTQFIVANFKKNLKTQDRYFPTSLMNF